MESIKEKLFQLIQRRNTINMDEISFLLFVKPSRSLSFRESNSLFIAIENLKEEGKVVKEQTNGKIIISIRK